LAVSNAAYYRMADYSNLAGKIDSSIESVVFDTIDSTNDYLSNLAFTKTTQVCITRNQTQGRGQYGRVWLSQKDANILFSMRYIFDASIALNGLSLVIGLSVVSTLADFGVSGIKLKWPNDIFYEDKKLAGILIENSAQGQYQSVVVGLGLNYNLNQTFECDSPWIDLSRIRVNLPTIEGLSAALINNMLKYCQLFATQGLPCFLKSWETVDYLIGKRVELITNNQKKIGIAVGINQQGALIIDTKGSLIEAYSSEQIRLI